MSLVKYFAKRNLLNDWEKQKVNSNCKEIVSRFFNIPQKEVLSYIIEDAYKGSKSKRKFRGQFIDLMDSSYPTLLGFTGIDYDSDNYIDVYMTGSLQSIKVVGIEHFVSSFTILSGSVVGSFNSICDDKDVCIIGTNSRILKSFRLFNIPSNNLSLRLSDCSIQSCFYKSNFNKVDIALVGCAVKNSFNSCEIGKLSLDYDSNTTFKTCFTGCKCKELIIKNPKKGLDLDIEYGLMVLEVEENLEGVFNNTILEVDTVLVSTSNPDLKVIDSFNSNISNGKPLRLLIYDRIKKQLFKIVTVVSDGTDNLVFKINSDISEFIDSFVPKYNVIVFDEDKGKVLLYGDIKGVEFRDCDLETIAFKTINIGSDNINSSVVNCFNNESWCEHSNVVAINGSVLTSFNNLTVTRLDLEVGNNCITNDSFNNIFSRWVLSIEVENSHNNICNCFNDLSADIIKLKLKDCSVDCSFNNIYCDILEIYCDTDFSKVVNSLRGISCKELRLRTSEPASDICLDLSESHLDKLTIIENTDVEFRINGLKNVNLLEIDWLGYIGESAVNTNFVYTGDTDIRKAIDHVFSKDTLKDVKVGTFRAYRGRRR